MFEYLTSYDRAIKNLASEITGLNTLTTKEAPSHLGLELLPTYLFGLFSLTHFSLYYQTLHFSSDLFFN